MGLFSTKTKSTTTPNVPEWASGPMQGLFGDVAGLAGQDPSSFVAPANDSLMAANDRAMQLGASPLYDEAAAGIRSLIAGPGTQAGSGQWKGVDAFMNPFLEDVVARTAADLNTQGDRQIQGTLLGYAGPNMGSNAAVAEALTRGEVTRGIGDVLSGLRKGGWDSAAGLADSQAGRDQQTNMLNAQLASQERAQNLGAMMQLASLGGAQAADTRANIGTLLDTGGTLQDIQQAQAGAPITVAGDLAGIMSGLSSPFIGQTTKGKTSGGLGSVLGGLGSLAMGAGGLGWKPFG